MNIHFSVWGAGTSELNIASYARCDYLTKPYEAVVASIERSSGLVFCGGPRDDGYCPRTRQTTYSGTLGKPSPYGGCNVVCNIWFTIDADDFDRWTSEGARDRAEEHEMLMATWAEDEERRNRLWLEQNRYLIVTSEEEVVAGRSTREEAEYVASTIKGAHVEPSGWEVRS